MTTVNRMRDMGAMARLLDKARERCSLASDNALSARLGVHRQSVSAWRKGETYPEEEKIAQIAHMAAEDAGAWLVAVKAERTSGEAGREWAKLARKLGAAAAVLLAVFCYAPGAGATNPDFAENTGSAYYVKSRWGLARRLLSFLSQLMRQVRYGRPALLPA